MKTKTYFRLSVAAIFTLMISCNNPTTKTDPLTDGNTTNTNPDGKTRHTIPIADIKLMINKYRTERQELINKNPELQKQYGDNFSDSRCAWFSIDELKAFIAEVEKQNSKTKLTGLRMYYTVYPEKKEGESSYLSSIPAQDRNHSSLLLIPTYYDERSKEHVDFAPEPPATEGAGQNNTHAENGERSAAAFDASQSAAALNHAGLCPPNCPTTSSASYLEN